MKASNYLSGYKAMVNPDPDNVMTLDFETFYDSKSGYSLKKMSMEEYIRDPRFKVHGLGVKKGSGDTHWLSGDRSIRQFLQSVPIHRYVAVAQNASFDGLILSHVYDVRPAAWIDTASMAAMIYGNTITSVSLGKLAKKFLPGHKKDVSSLVDVDGVRNPSEDQLAALGVYCADDVNMTYLLFRKFLPMLQESPTNIDLINLITTMFTDPVLELDVPVLDQLIANELVEKQAALDASAATSMKQLNSNPQLATLLKSLGVEPPMKISDTTGKETYAFAKDDRDFVALLRHEDERVRKLVEARMRCKTSINETRAKSYKAVAERGPWPVHLNVSGARTTHRLSGGSGGGGNPQNLGKTSPLRQAILPPEGMRMFAIDSSNIELRTAMTLAGEWDVVSRMNDPDFDLYSVFASVIYDCAVENIVKEQRFVGKVACLQLQYGSGAATFRDMAWSWGAEIEPDEAARITMLYRQSFPKIKRTWDVCDRILNLMLRGKEEETWFDVLAHAKLDGPMGQPSIYMPETGLSLTYPNLRREYDEDSKRWRIVYDGFDKKTYRHYPVALYGAKLFQNICQSLARNVVMEQTLALDQFLKQEIHHTCRTTMSVHDEAVCLVPEDADCDAAIQGALEIFKTPPAWWPELPTFGEAAYGDNYGEAKT